MVGKPCFDSAFSPFCAVPLAVLVMVAVSGMASDVCLLEEESLVLVISSDSVVAGWVSAGVASIPCSLATLASDTEAGAVNAIGLECERLLLLPSATREFLVS